jgi:hypothetical protein
VSFSRASAFALRASADKTPDKQHRLLRLDVLSLVAVWLQKMIPNGAAWSNRENARENNGVKVIQDG